MLKFIWNSWWRNKERFILLMVGMLIVSTGLSYLLGVTQANNGTVVNELQKRWDSSYHIVVRPEGSRSVTEDLNLLEPNYMSGLEGGITREQYETIQQIADVDVAAPIAMIGSTYSSSFTQTHTFDKAGLYRLKMNTLIDTGIEKINDFQDLKAYFWVGWMPNGDSTHIGIGPTALYEEFPLDYGSDVMLAGIDPVAEAKLVGLDDAVQATEFSRYFNEEDVPEPYDEEVTTIPILMSTKDYVDASINYTIEEIDVDTTDQEAFIKTYLEKGKDEYLDSLKGTKVASYDFTAQQMHDNITKHILEGKPQPQDPRLTMEYTWIAEKASPLVYEGVTSPFPKRWPYSYQIKPFLAEGRVAYGQESMYRKSNLYAEDINDAPKVRYNYIGLFDPSKLNLSKDPLTELPMETYFPASADWVMNSKDEPVNPPTTVKPTNNPYSFLTKPPSMLTTLDAAFAIAGDKAISAIRVNVKGVDVLNEESEAKLQAVAKEIEDKTGLITDVTLGSSPQYAVTYLPGLKGESALGWIQQPWIKLGSSITIFQEAKLGFSGVVASVILVAMLYVFSSNIIMLYARKKEFAILLSLGWRPSQLSKLLFLEATILGSMVALISWMILGTFLWTAAGSTSITRILLIGLAGLLIYWLGTLIPIRLVRRIKPYETMQSGEVSKGRRLLRSRSSVGMSLNQLVTYWPRTTLSILAIALPTSLFGFFLFVTFRLQGVLYTTWIGEFVALEVGTMHYVAMGVALLIAMLTTTEIMWQNVSERKPQLAVLKALGWQNTSIRRLVLTEGALTGFFAGLLGVTVTIIIVTIMYQKFPTTELPFLFATILIPVVTGVLGALLPAERAVRITPAEAIGGHVVNQKKVEKRFRLVLGTTATALVVGIISLFVFTSPEVKPVTEEAKSTPAPTAQTTGAKQADLKADKPKETKATTPKEDDLQKIMNLGTFQTFIGDPQMKKREFQVGEPVYASPDGTEPEAGKRFVSLPISLFHEDDGYGGTMDYRPNGFRMYTPDGTEYTPVDVVNHNKKAFRGGFIYTPGEKSEIDLVFLVPEKEKTLVLYASSGAMPKVYTVKIEVP